MQNKRARRETLSSQLTYCCLPPPSSATQYGFTPLHRAADGGHAKCLAVLIAAGASIDAVDEKVPAQPYHSSFCVVHKCCRSDAFAE